MLRAAGRLTSPCREDRTLVAFSGAAERVVACAEREAAAHVPFTGPGARSVQRGPPTRRSCPSGTCRHRTTGRCDSCTETVEKKPNEVPGGRAGEEPSSACAEVYLQIRTALMTAALSCGNAFRVFSPVEPRQIHFSGSDAERRHDTVRTRAHFQTTPRPLPFVPLQARRRKL
ncbi:hypothetical protein ROHU_026906 [Labeo rohita]|uniref:Uncharacterized protein n=1 Tax=Labeo rohita TaxID=84645 RepID=A0A498ME57_LABRO|nr:hypothetical protein ROHU_026906 [Labeo rohita]